MKTSFIFLAALTAALFFITPPAGALTGNLTFSGGLVRTHDDFSRSFDIDELTSLGVFCDVKKEAWPVYITAAYVFAYGQSRAADVYCSDTLVGLKKFFELSPAVRPYIAGGVSSLSIYADMAHDDDYDGAWGGWYGAGLAVSLSHHWQMHLDWRRTSAKVDLFRHRLEAGGDSFSFAIGYRFR